MARHGKVRVRPLSGTMITQTSIVAILVAFLTLGTAGLGAQAPGARATQVEIDQDENGYRLMVDGEPFEVKGVVWSYVPIGENYTFDLWSQPEDYIRKMIDRDAEMMKAMGVNAIRVFSDVPPQWITYFYRQHGIYTIANYLFGRYGMNVRGIWYPQTDYSDFYTRLKILEEAQEYVETYKDVPGVLMIMFGNENNYGLEWDSGQIEDLPVGQRSEVRAGYLYSLFEEAISVGRTIAPHVPFGIVNGDIQYINLIQELIPSLQILGVNTYRGGEAYDLFFQSIRDLGVPFVYTEFGADAFNAKTGHEDQYNQADYIHRQWREIYQQSYGKGGYGNALGGFVFEWMDEWWKYDQEDYLDEHNVTGTWTNGGYPHDAAPGVNNMQEEWFGIVAQSPRKVDGINLRIPRSAYYMLQDLWELSMYDSTLDQVDAHFDRFNPGYYTDRGSFDVLAEAERYRPITIDELRARITGRVTLDDEDISSGDIRTDGDVDGSQEVALTLGLQPLDKLQGHVELRAWNQPEISPFDPLISSPQYFGYDSDTGTIDTNIAIYGAEFTLDEDLFDLHGYYRTGRADWFLHGDPFYLMPEAWDRYSMDRDGSDAPFGLELIGKDALEGLYIAVGPELYWGALPQAAINYSTRFGEEGVYGNLGFMYREAFGTRGDAFPGFKIGRKASISGGIDVAPYVSAQLSVLHSGAEHIGTEYQTATKVGSGLGVGGSDYDVETKSIEVLDTFAFKGQITSDIFAYTRFYARYLYAGLVATAEPMVPRSGFQVADSGSGNRSQLDIGGRFIFGDFAAEGEFRYRAPLAGPMVAVGGNSVRSTLTDPFAVFHNRETTQAELVLTYDPEGATYFHEWNNLDRETAPFAASLSTLFTFYAGPTDANIYINADDNWASFNQGLPEAENLWAVKARMLANPLPGFRVYLNGAMGSDQSSGEDSRQVNYANVGLGLRWDRIIFDGMVHFNSWGPELWYRNFNLTYPLQWEAELAFAFDPPSFLDQELRIGIRNEGRSYGDYTADEEPNDGFTMITSFYVEL